MSGHRSRAALAVVLSVWAFSCDEKPTPTSSPTPAASPAPTPREPAKPAGPPDFEIDTLGAKVGFERALLDQASGRNVLSALLAPTEKFVTGTDVSLIVDRNVKLTFVSTFIDELGKVGAKRVIVKTETRHEYPSSLSFLPELTLKPPADCSTIAMVLEDRGTAVWKLSGGVATKHGKGMAGPDLSMTGDNIERFAKHCTRSALLFVSAAPSVEWGLAYDLAASAKTLHDPGFDDFVLLGETPVPGHPVKLRH